MRLPLLYSATLFPVGIAAGILCIGCVPRNPPDVAEVAAPSEAPLPPVPLTKKTNSSWHSVSTENKSATVTFGDTTTETTDSGSTDETTETKDGVTTKTVTVTDGDGTKHVRKWVDGHLTLSTTQKKNGTPEPDAK